MPRAGKPVRCRFLLAIVLLLHLLPTAAALAQNNTKQGDTRGDTSYETATSDFPGVMDTASVRLLPIPDNQLEAYRNNPDFDYDNVQPSESIWDRFLLWLNEIIESLLPDESKYVADSILYDWVPWLFVVGMISVVGWFLYRHGISGVVARRDIDAVGRFGEIDSDVPEGEDLLKLIEEAISEGRYRRAVRFLYIVALRDLADRGLITPRRDRTNAEYIRELTGTSLASGFEQVTRLFEYVWYGDAHVGATSFPPIRRAFSEFTAQLPPQ